MSAFLPAIPLTDIAESPFNPRRLFHGPAMAELAESIRSQGVLSPVLVRPLAEIAADNAQAVYELVFGHRRFRAAKLAGLAAVPAIVEEMSDAEALEKQVIENGQRADMTPIEEAEGYLRLHEKHGLPVAEIAQKVGKSETHIRQRMQLAQLPEQAMLAVSSGDLALSVALALARMPNPELRTKAAAEVLEVTVREQWDGDAGEMVEIRERMSTEKALRHIRARYSLRLEGCGWSLDDADLPGGACARCPKRSGNLGYLFPDLAAKDDLCLDPDCFAAKREAAWARRKAELQAAGREVLDGKAAAKVVHEYGVVPSSGFVEAATVCHDDPKGRTWGSVLGKGAEARLVVARDATGKEHLLVPAEIIAEKKKELAAKRKADPKEREEDEEQDVAEFEGEVAHLAAELTVARCVEVAESVDADGTKLWRECAELLLAAAEENYNKSAVTHVGQRRGLVGEHAEDEAVGELRQALRSTLTTAQIRGLVLELAAAGAHCFETWGGGGADALAALSQGLGVNAKATEKAARKQLEAKRKAEAAAKEARAKGKKSGAGLKASAFQLGDHVTYQQGAGRFDSTVRSVDPETGTVELERCKDGKIVVRPAVKVTKGWET